MLWSATGAATGVALLGAAPAAAEVRALVSVPLDPTAASGAVEVDLLFANAGDRPESVAAPERVNAELRVHERAIPVVLQRVSSERSPIAVAAGGFQRIGYRLELPTELAAGTLAMLSVPALSSNSAAIIVPRSPAAAAQARTAITPAPALPALESATVAELPRQSGNMFLPGLSAYEPIYAVSGAGTNTNVKLQLSFKYQLFGEQGVFGSRRSWLDGLHFAYTQRMYWDTEQSSLPFRNIDFQPELIYLLQSRGHEGQPRYRVQLGLRHESNGREGPASRSVNIAYLQPTLATSVAGQDVTIGPRAWFYFGGQDGNENIERYRGHAGLSLGIGNDDGLRLTSFARYNIGSDKGAAQIDVSYPLSRLIWDRLNLYVYGQLYAGYGENLLDYDRRATRARIGVAIVR